MVAPLAARVAAVQGDSDRGQGAFGFSLRALPSQAGATAAGTGGAVARLSTRRSRLAELPGTTGAMEDGVELCDLDLADLGSGGSADGGRVRPGERAAGSAADVCAPAGMGCELTMCSRLRGGGDRAGDDSMSQQSLDERPAVEEDYQGATQAYDESSDEEAAVGHVQRVDHGGEGETFDLPDGDKVDVLTFGRLQQDGTRGSSRVSSVVLRDTRPTPLVSVLQAEIVCDGDGLRFKSMGKTFNHVNNTPLHGTIKRYEKSALIYDGDVLRLGGNLDNKTDGGLTEHVFRVHAPALGARPTAETAARAASPTASPAAAAAAAAAPAPAPAPAPAQAPAPAAAAPAALPATTLGLLRNESAGTDSWHR